MLAVPDKTSGSSLTPAVVLADVSPLSLRQNKILSETKGAREAQKLRAEKIVKISGSSRLLLIEANIRDVTVPIPNVDRRIIAVIVERDSQELYKFATNSSVLGGKFCRNQFDICRQTLYSIEDVDTQKMFPLRKAVQEVST